MKNNFLVLIVVIAISLSSNCQSITVPLAVTNAFNNKFPNATGLKWEKENSRELEANFRLNNTNVSVNFTLDGSWMETETTINASDLPAAITDAINTKYPGSVIYLAERIEKPGNKILYEVNIKVKGKKKELEMNPDGSLEK